LSYPVPLQLSFFATYNTALKLLCLDLTQHLTLVISFDGNWAKSAFMLPPALRLATSCTTSTCSRKLTIIHYASLHKLNLHVI